MKKLTLFLAILSASFLVSCSHFYGDYGQRVGAARPKPEGRPTLVPFGTHDAVVYTNCVHFKLPPNLGLLSPSEVWVYNLDRDAANTYDTVWIRPEGPDSWEFGQNANLYRGVTARSVLKPADPNTVLIWLDHAQKARSLSPRSAPGTPKVSPPKSEPARNVPRHDSFPKEKWKPIETDDGSVIWEKISP